ncbi:MAG: 6-phosphogluconolactonase [Candidatus Heimdallarchaeota archaeon LC_3]|nr:MAG: 6-phosphogluconolactonase [Candidatus Heimdallarchaeota archaeon LC_3]
MRLNKKSVTDKILIGKTTKEFIDIAVDTILKELVSSGSTSIVLAVSGGSTPIPIYEKMSNLLVNSEIDPKNIFLIWIDERWVPHDSEGSNYKLIKDTLLKSRVIPEENIYPIPTMLKNPREAIIIYEKTLNDLFNRLGKKSNLIDLSIMGVGSDGHTASIFPGIDELKNIKNQNWVIVPYVKKLDAYRVSLTPKLINSSKTIIYLVKGKEKASIFNFLMKTKNIIHYPVQLIKPKNGKIIWVLDVDAFSEVGEVIKDD